MTGPYDDLMDLPHPVSAKHPRMSLSDRAAQFSPFAALTGHEAAIQETARLTDSRAELDETMIAELDAKLRVIADHLDEHPEVNITYFRVDEKKAGGSYIRTTGFILKIDEFQRIIIMEDGTQIPIDDICEIESRIL